jgi:hypothetical protein
MEKNVMRSMELVSRERMEVAVSFGELTFILYHANWSSSNNFPSGARPVTTTCLTSQISSEC